MIPLKIKLAAAMIAAAFLAVTAWNVVDAITRGRVATAVENSQQEGRDAVDAVSSARQRVRACAARGGLWDRATGECQPGVPVAR